VWLENIPPELAKSAHERVGRYVKLSQKWSAAQAEDVSQYQNTISRLQTQLQANQSDLREQEALRNRESHAQSQILSLTTQLQGLQASAAQHDMSKKDMEEELLSALNELEKSKQTMALLKYEKQQQLERAMEADNLLQESRSREKNLAARVKRLEAELSQRDHAPSPAAEFVDDEFSVVHEPHAAPYQHSYAPRANMPTASPFGARY